MPKNLDVSIKPNHPENSKHGPFQNHNTSIALNAMSIRSATTLGGTQVKPSTQSYMAMNERKMVTPHHSTSKKCETDGPEGPPIL